MNEAELDPRNEKAIAAALAAKWEEAVKLNLEILKDFPDNTDALNRAGRAYSEIGNINKAKSSFQKVLDLDPYNSIATNNLKRLSSLSSADAKKTSGAAVNPDIFLEEPGKTKVIELEDLAMNTLVATLRTGDPVKLSTTKADVSIISQAGKRIGKLPAVWGKQISEATRAGSEFSAVVKAVTINKEPQVSILIREEKRSPRLPQAIFQTENSNFTPYIREEALGLLANQSPVQTDTEEGGTEEIEIKDLSSNTTTSSLEEFQTRELGASDAYDEESNS